MIFNKFSSVMILLAVILTITALFYINQKYPSITYYFPKYEHKNSPAFSTPSLIKDGDGGSLNPIYPTLYPKSLNLPVPFTPQAPTANWDELHNEACEEASTIMVAIYFSSVIPDATEGNPESFPGSKIKTQDEIINLPAEFVENEIQKLTNWQKKTFGYYLDTTSAETARMIEEVYELKTKLINNFNSDEIKKELAQNRLVIVSEYGRDLNNPNYKLPGPIHHMLIIKGYDSKGNFITNDPGTKRGLNYPYDFETIYNAAGDWDHTTKNIDKKIKTAIVIWE